jgi:hypothetical protein
MDGTKERAPHCGADCGGCPGGDSSPAAAGLPYRGWQVVLGALGIFLAPLALAIAGSLLLGGTGGGQLAGALAGLGAGMGLAWLVGLHLRRPTKERS